MDQPYTNQQIPIWICHYSLFWAGMIGAVGKISALRLQGPRFNPGSDEIWIFVWSSFPPKLTQLSILVG